MKTNKERGLASVMLPREKRDELKKRARAERKVLYGLALELIEKGEEYEKILARR